MAETRWFAVRCCCTPRKIFGFMKLESPLGNQRLPYTLAIQDSEGRSHSITIRSIFVRRMATIRDMERAPDEVVEFTSPELAIYSDDRPIEFWRTIRGFIEAQSED